MKFISHLTEAVLLKRQIKFLAEVVLPNRQKLMIRCPNLSSMLGCDLLGTKLWYSNAIGYHCLPTWELVEVDGGHLVSINPELVRPLVLEALKKDVIKELRGYSLLHLGGNGEQFFNQMLFLEEGDQQCYVGLEHLILGDSQGVGYFPETLGAGLENLNALIRAKEEGYRAVLLYCVAHTGVESIKPATHNIDSNYRANLNQAIEKGVEIIAYKAAISLQNIDLNTQVAVLLSEDAVSR